MEIFNYKRYILEEDVQILIEAFAEKKRDSDILNEIIMNTSHAELCCYANEIKIPLKKRICISIKRSKIEVFEKK